MSVTPKNLPKRTLVLIKDLIFQEKYGLTHSQMDLMAYIVNASYWAICVEGYFVLATNKILSDLPHIGLKTLEANLKALKDLQLIKTTKVQVKEWTGKPRLRGVQLTTYGKEYNNHYITSMDDRERKELKDKIKKLEAHNKELEDKQKELEKALANLQVPQDKTEPKEQTEQKTEPKPTPTNKLELSKEEKSFVDFINDVRKKYQALSKPICNCVPTWQKECKFYINSYNKLAIELPNGEFQQIKDPNKIKLFWEHLYNNPSKIGIVIDFSKPINYSELINRYRFTTIKWGKNMATIVNFIEKDIGKTATIEILEDGKTDTIIIKNKNGEDAVLAFEYIEGFVLKNMV